MSWASGSEILQQVWDITRQFVPKNKRVKVFAELIEIFENHDCDTTYELLEEWPEAKEALEINGHEFEDEE